MKIVWINSEDVCMYEGRLFSTRASVRLRCIEPTLYLKQKGHEVLLLNIFKWQSWIQDSNFYNADVYVIGKAFLNPLPIIQYLQHLGKRVVIDVCDNIFEPPEDGLKEIYESILPLADTLVVASHKLANVLENRIRNKVTIIPDHVEGSKQSPLFNPNNQTLNLLWFGYPNNLSALDEFLPKLGFLSKEKTVHLSIVTSWINYYSEIFKDGRSGIHIRQVEWSPMAMTQELFNCDLVIIPSNKKPANLTKTANRVITSLYAGRYVVAYPLPAYLEFQSFISLGEDLVKNIQFCLENPDIVRRRITDGQEYIEKHYSPKIISQLWETALIYE